MFAKIAFAVWQIFYIVANFVDQINPRRQTINLNATGFLRRLINFDKRLLKIMMVLKFV